jgi:hypothetical protein
MVSFVVGLLVIATNQVVSIINTALPNIVLIIVAVVMFLMLVGTFYKEGDFDFAGKYKKTTMWFMFAILVLILIIFAGSFTLSSGETLIESLFSGSSNANPIVTSSIIFAVIALLAVIIVMKKPSGDKP